MLLLLLFQPLLLLPLLFSGQLFTVVVLRVGVAPEPMFGRVELLECDVLLLLMLVRGCAVVAGALELERVGAVVERVLLLLA